jgi:hypothetical protein
MAGQQDSTMTQELKQRLEEDDVPEAVMVRLNKDLGVVKVDHLVFITAEDLVALGMKQIPARVLVASWTCGSSPKKWRDVPRPSYLRAGIFGDIYQVAATDKYLDI